MARAKRVSDEEIITAALEVIAESGPSFTLAEVGDMVGLSAATVVQRFETKRHLRIKIAESRNSRVMAANFGGPGHPLDRLARGLAETSGWMQTPRRVGNVMAVLLNDMTDPDFRDIASVALTRRRDSIVEVLEPAIESGHMKQCDAEAVARQVQTAVLGAHQTWSMEPEGELVDWIEECTRGSVAKWRIDPS